jgi:hypothetical protein
VVDDSHESLPRSPVHGSHVGLVLQLSLILDAQGRRIIGSLFDGRVEASARVGNHEAIVPAISGWARQHGINTIFVDDRDPFAKGFQV